MPDTSALKVEPGSKVDLIVDGKDFRAVPRPQFAGDFQRPADDAGAGERRPRVHGHRARACGRAGGVGDLQRSAADGRAAGVGVAAGEGQAPVPALFSDPAPESWPL